MEELHKGLSIPKESKEIINNINIEIDKRGLREIIKELFKKDKTLDNNINTMNAVISHFDGLISNPTGELSRDDINYLLSTLDSCNKKYKVIIKKKILYNVKNKVLGYIANRKRWNATEIVVSYILNTEYIYSIRQDESQEIWIYRNGIYVPDAISYIKEVCRDIFFIFHNSNLTKQVVDKIESETFIEKDIFFQISNPSRIAVKNGILDVIEKKLYPFDPKEIHFNKINVKYDPKAVCPSIERHFNEVLKKEDDIRIIYEFFGYCLYRDYKIEKAFMLFGDGRNGKSKTVELLKRFLGAENCCNISLEQIEKDAFGLANFQNKMVNIGSDISSTALKNTGNFKQLTGHDMITTNRKNKSYISFINYAKLIFCANDLPQTKDSSSSFWNRWVMMEFPYTFLSQKEINLLPDKEKHMVKLADPEHINKLLDNYELSGLLNLALKGLERLFKNKDFSNCDSYNDIKIKWIRASDSVLSFFLDCIIIDYDSEIETGELKKAYHNYCVKYKLKSLPEKQVIEKLRNNFPTDLRRIRNITNDYYAWQSIKLNN